MRGVFLAGALLSLLCLLSGCAFDNDVGQGGDYSFLPRRDVNDVAPRPLRHLLIVEEDGYTGAALVYLFSGDLGAADLGFSDLRRVRSYHGRSRMDFEPPRASYLVEDLEPMLEDDAAWSGESLRLQTADGADARLLELNSAALAATGARRFLRTVDSSDFDVRAFFGHFALSGSLPELMLEIEGATLVLEPELRAARLEVEREDELLHLDHGELPGADYVAIEAFQVIRELVPGDADDDAGARPDPALDAGRIGDAGGDAGGMPAPEPPRTLEAMATATFAPDAAYQVSDGFLTDVAGQGCWSVDEPLTLRLVQVARSYRVRAAGDWAVIHRRIDAAAVEPALWSADLPDPTPAGYCEDFE